MTTSSTALALPVTGAHRRERIAPWWHTVLLIVVLVVYAIAASRPAHVAKIAGLPDRSMRYLEGIGMEFGVFLYTWFGLTRCGIKIGTVIGGKWRRVRDFFADFGTAMLFWVVVIFVLLLLHPILKTNDANVIRIIAPRSGRELLFYIPFAASAGFCEEFIFRGYLQRQFISLFRTAWAAIVTQSIIFGFVHLYQGWNHAIAIGVYGALFGILAHMRKSLRPGMIQHFCEDSAVGLLAFVLLRRRLI